MKKESVSGALGVLYEVFSQFTKEYESPILKEFDLIYNTSGEDQIQSKLGHYSVSELLYFAADVADEVELRLKDHENS